MAQGQDTGGAGGGLSTGAQVGIGIGGALVAIAIGLGLFAFFSRRRRGTIEAAEKLAASSNENTDVYHARQELEAGPNTRMETDAADVSRGAAGSDVRFETEGDSEWLPQELDSSGAPPEVDSVQLAAEMPASPARVEPNGRVRFGRRLRGSREPT